MWVVVVGSSLGGWGVLSVILPGLAASFPAAIAIVQHRRADHRSQLDELLARRCSLPVIEPCHGALLRAGTVYLAPPDYHLLIEPGVIALSIDSPVCCARPSTDVLFTSAAQAYGANTIGVALTGANADGADGAAAIEAHGGRVIVQDPTTAESPVCPEAVLGRVRRATVLPPQAIAATLLSWCQAKSNEPT
jgi:two-component system chemotaxis response regulator CheB